MDAPSKFPRPPDRVPPFLEREFKYGKRRVVIKPGYSDESGGQGHRTVWTQEEVEDMRKRAR